MNKQQERKKLAFQKAAARIIEKNHPEGQRLSNTPLWEILAFVLPFVFVLYGFYKNGMYPFGDQQFLVTDLWHQYYPFFQLLSEKLKEGGSLLYSWRTGGGTNFLSLIAYYAASPLNILSLLFSTENLRTGLMVILLFKFGFAGWFFAKFLRYTFKKNDISLVMFACMYALCAWMMGYYWNVIWVDTVALLPLVMLGLVALVREGKYRLYVIALAVALLSNYYIAYFICIFTILVFFILCLFEGVKFKAFAKRFALLTGGSLLGAGLVSWILLPAYFALQLTYSVNNTFPTTVKWYESWVDIISNMLAFTDPTKTEGLPNLYCGWLPVLLLGVFLGAKQIRIREKICGVIMLVLLLVSCNLNILNFIWHGFHFTNMIPYRFSFLFSFVLLVMGYRAYLIVLEEKFKWSYWLMMLASCAVFCGIAYQAEYEDYTFITYCFILGSVYLCCLICKTFVSPNIVQYLLAAVLAFEMGTQAINGVETVGSSSYTSYPTKLEDVTTLLEQMDEVEDELFYRSELTAWYTLNDPSLYYYNGISQFSSMANVHITAFMRLIGLPAKEGSNRYFYANTSPLTNMLLDVQYVIAKDGYNADTLCWEEIGTSGNCTLYQSLYALSLGYMVESGLGEYALDSDLNAFDQQNALFKQMTGIEEDLFTRIEITDVGHHGYSVVKTDYGQYSFTLDEDTSEGTYLKYNYTALTEGMVYAYMTVTDGKNMDVYVDGETVHSYEIKRQPYITPVGYYQEGERITLRCDLSEDTASGTATVYCYQLNTEVLEKGYALLADELLTITEFSDTSVKGTITAQSEGYLYLAINYESGWSCKVDGVETEITALLDAMCGIYLSAGEHTIELSYSPKGFVPGMVFAIGCILLLVLLWWLEKKGKIHISNLEVANVEEVEAIEAKTDGEDIPQNLLEEKASEEENAKE